VTGFTAQRAGAQFVRNILARAYEQRGPRLADTRATVL